METKKKNQRERVKELNQKELQSIFGGTYVKVIINGQIKWIYLK